MLQAGRRILRRTCLACTNTRIRTLSTSSIPLRSSSQTQSPRPPSTQPPRRTLNPQALLAHYAQTPVHSVTLDDLQKYGMPPLSREALLESAERTRTELLAGLARRVTAHISLPFLPATNPSLQQIHNLYSTAFASLAAVPEIKTLEDNDRLCQVMAEMVQQHSDNIPILARGFKETRKYLADSVIKSFLDRAIKNRITLRLQAEQHLNLSASTLPSLSHSSSTPTPSIAFSTEDQTIPRSPSSSSNPISNLDQQQSNTNNRLGVLDLSLSPKNLIKACASYVSELCEATYGVSPRYRIEGSGSETTVGSIGVHLEYIMTELLKNAFRATVEHHLPKNDDKKKKEEDKGDDVFRFEDLMAAHLSKDDFPEVAITIAVAPGVLTIRIRDQGGGIPPEDLPEVFSYSFTSVKQQVDPDADPDSPGSTTDMYGGSSGNAGYYGGVGGGPVGGESPLKTGMGTLAGLGFGLPLSRIYAEYWDGSLDLSSIPGWGVDTYTVLRTL